MALATPFVSTFADKYPRKRVMIYSDLYSAVLVVLATVCLYADTSALPIFVLAVADRVRRVGVPGRPGCHHASAGEHHRAADRLQRHGQHPGEPGDLRRSGHRRGAAGGRRRRDRVPPERRVVRVVDAAWWPASTWAGPRKSRRRRPSPRAWARRSPRRPRRRPRQAEGFLRETSAGFRAIWRDKDLLDDGGRGIRPDGRRRRPRGDPPGDRRGDLAHRGQGRRAARLRDRAWGRSSAGSSRSPAPRSTSSARTSSSGSSCGRSP